MEVHSLTRSNWSLKRGSKMSNLLVQTQSEVVVLSPSGEVTREHLSGLPDLSRTVEEQLDAGKKRFALNLKNVSYIDTSGLGMIFGMYKRIMKKDGHLVIAEIPSRLQRVFDVMDIGSIMRITGSLEEALDSLAQRVE
jgi:anti-anti-sigma factor